MTSHRNLATPLLVRSALIGAVMALGCGSAFANSQYGFNSTGAGTVTAQASLNLSITVPKLILLRVGSTNTTVDTLSWTSAITIPGGGVTPTTTANNQAVDWNATLPTASTGTNPAAVAVAAWTNASGGGSLGYTATAFGANGPQLSNIAVTSAAGLAHPLPATLATASTTATPIPVAALNTGSWSFALTGSPATWHAGTYTTTIVYTATSL